jgi:hypothetical protein
MNPDEELEVRMAVSSDRGATFSTSHFPYKLSEKSYRVVDSKESSVFVQVMLLSHASQTPTDRSEGRTFFKPHTSMERHSSNPTHQWNDILQTPHINVRDLYLHHFSVEVAKL